LDGNQPESRRMTSPTPLEKLRAITRGTLPPPPERVISFKPSAFFTEKTQAESHLSSNSFISLYDNTRLHRHRPLKPYEKNEKTSITRNDGTRESPRLSNEKNEIDEERRPASIFPAKKPQPFYEITPPAEVGRWREAFAGLISTPSPAGFSEERWRRIIDATGVFLHRWAETAIELGWTTLDVFGCADAAPAQRFDCMGLVLLLDRCRIADIDAAGADLVATTNEARLRFRRRAMPKGTVPLWRVGKKPT
jgi:hypothetical protein